MGVLICAVYRGSLGAVSLAVAPGFSGLRRESSHAGCRQGSASAGLSTSSKCGSVAGSGVFLFVLFCCLFHFRRILAGIWFFLAVHKTPEAVLQDVG